MDISKIIDKVSEHTGLKAYIANDPNLELKTIPFGIPQLDACVGGGIPCGRITEIVGEYSVGKSFLTSKVMVSAQKMGMYVVMFNVENKVDPAWLKKCGVDIEKLIIIQGNIGESIIDSVTAMAEANVGLVVVDSIAALISVAEVEKDSEDQTMGMQPRMMSSGFKKILNPLSSSKTAIIFTNQLRSGIGKFATDTYPGGRAQYFYSSMTIFVRRGEWFVDTVGENEVRKGFRIECKTVKNTIAPPFRECSIPFLFTGEVDLVLTICEMARDNGILIKGGSWFTLHNGDRLQGWDNVVNFYRTNSDKLNELSSKLAGE